MLTDLSLRGFYRTGGRRSGAIGLVSCEFCVCSSCSCEVCVRFHYFLPFPWFSHRFDHEIREDRATQEVNPSIIWYQQLLVATDFSSIWSFPHKFENSTKNSPNSCFGSICDLSAFW